MLTFPCYIALNFYSLSCLSSAAVNGSTMFLQDLTYETMVALDPNLNKILVLKIISSI